MCEKKAECSRRGVLVNLAAIALSIAVAVAVPIVTLGDKAVAEDDQRPKSPSKDDGTDAADQVFKFRRIR